MTIIKLSSLVVIRKAIPFLTIILLCANKASACDEPSVSLTSPASVGINESIPLNWTSVHTDSCVGEAVPGNGPINLGTNGNQPVGPLTVDTVFTLSCTGSGGTATQSITATVGATTVDLVAGDEEIVSTCGALPSVSFTSVPLSVNPGESGLLTWESENVDSCQGQKAGGPLVGVPTSETEGLPTGELIEDTEFTIICTGSGGSDSDSIIVTINQPTPAPTVNLSVNTEQVLINGTVELEWNSTDATSCEASGAWSGNRDLNSSAPEISATLIEDSTFTLTCINGEIEVSDSVDIIVNTTTPLVCDTPEDICYDIVYVRYPDPGAGNFVPIPQGEHAYDLVASADLMLRKQNGDEEVLVDCDANCSVMDPYISLDGKTVYYSLNTVVGSPLGNDGDTFESFIYKINLDEQPYTPIRLTYDDGFDSALFKANRDGGDQIKPGHDQRTWRAIRDMAPVPLADGRLLFTSNRAALTTFHPFKDAVIEGSIQLMYVMDDHDGSAVTAELANIQRLETGNIHMVQHPMQLKDGRILFSTWQDAGTKFDGENFRYAMTSLFTVHPDGSNLRQFTEPHDHHKNLDHFISQLSNRDVVWANYYPSFDYGYGIIMRAPVNPDGPDFLRQPDQSVTFNYPPFHQISFREFDRKDMVTLTPHTTPGDDPAPNRSGKYSMPSAGAGDGLLVAYSKGYVNHFDFYCGSGTCEKLRSGICLIPNATGSDFIEDPAQLIEVVDHPDYNEIWPRAVLSYSDIYGVAKPDSINNLATSAPDDDRLEAGEANAIVGTSSMYNREPNDGGDPFTPKGEKRGRESHDGNWTIQGAEAGAFTNEDIYGVRIIATPPQPYTKPISKYNDTVRWNGIARHLLDQGLDRVVARYGSDHGERWEILGEFPVKKSTPDEQGNPDTSWMAKVPAETPFFIQTIDDKGMTLVSEITWRALKPGEQRADCGGCHAHSIDPLDINNTLAGQRNPITGIPGVSDNDLKIANGLWDLTLNEIPLLNDNGVTFEPGYSYGVEFNRDIKPILDARCVNCHNASHTLNLVDDPWAALMAEKGEYDVPQVSRYIRTPQARQSLFVWAAWGERLDGRTNAERPQDIDYPDSHPSPAVTGITDEEMRTIARWVDLGSPIDFPVTDGVGYTDDYQLPVVNIYTPHLGSNNGTELRVGLADAKSGLDLSTLSVTYFHMDTEFVNQMPDPATSTDIEADIAALEVLIADSEVDVPVNPANDVNAKNILVKNLLLGSGEYVVTVSVEDNAGNIGLAYRRFTVN